jgi:MFS family permease
MAALLATTVGVLPVYAVGGLAVQLRAELAFGEGALGVAVAVFFATSAAASAPAGTWAERLGPRRSTVVGVAVAGSGALALGLFATTWWGLAVCLAVAGLGNALVQVAVNLRLARAVPPTHQGLAFGGKLSAIPAATLLAGAAVPAIALTVGWRVAFVVAAVLAAAAAVVQRPDVAPPDHVAALSPDVRRPDVAVHSLLVVAAGAGLGTAAANSVGAFLVDGAVAEGVSPARAGLLLTAGSALSIVVRLVAGHLADRGRDGAALPAVAAMLAVGAGGLVLLAGRGDGAVLWLAVALVFGAGWGWNGLFNLAVVRGNPTAPAAASGITQTGVYAGGVVGPPLFGLVAQHAGYPAAWRAAAVVAALAAATCLLGTRQLRPSRAR